MAILETINSPDDLKKLPLSQLPAVAAELRRMIIETCAKNGGHLAPSLGVVELTIALHRVFNSPADKIIWDVGHQAYAHKILTGRRERFSTLRTLNGIIRLPQAGRIAPRRFRRRPLLHLHLGCHRLCRGPRS